ncbi:MAG: quinolinate synthase NadA [Verrucomicrobiota bacterium]
MIEAPNTSTFTAAELDAEADRIFQRLFTIECSAEGSWTYERCQEIAPITLEIERLKIERNATVLAHSYVKPEIIYGVGDFVGDSYKLSVDAAENEKPVIVFSGVVFMAETAKILSPNARVYVPDMRSGCSLADSLTGPQLRELKAQIKGDFATVCYVNCNADVKAECDVCVTSTNVYKIIAALPQKKILFVPDRLMAENIRVEMRKLGIDKEILTSDGTCEVHDQFTHDLIAEARARYPGVAVVSHPECTRDITERSDFVGSTSAMMNYVKTTDKPYYMLLTECGLVSRLEVENPEKRFIGSCRMCPYMKMNSLEKIRDVLKFADPRLEVTLDEDIRIRAEASLRKMIEMTQA